MLLLLGPVISIHGAQRVQRHDQRIREASRFVCFMDPENMWQNCLSGSFHCFTYLGCPGVDFLGLHIMPKSQVPGPSWVSKCADAHLVSTQSMPTS